MRQGVLVCYNHSAPEGETQWQVDEVVCFVRDCTANGVKAVSFGGGEPLQYAGLFDLHHQLDGVVFRSVTTNGLLLYGENLDRLVAVKPNKLHISIHFADRANEVARVIAQVNELTGRGVRSGVNFLVTRSNLPAARDAARRVRDAGIGNDRIVYLPMRGRDTPTRNEMAEVHHHTPTVARANLRGTHGCDRRAGIGILWRNRGTLDDSRRLTLALA